MTLNAITFYTFPYPVRSLFDPVPSLTEMIGLPRSSSAALSSAYPISKLTDRDEVEYSEDGAGVGAEQEPNGTRRVSI